MAKNRNSKERGVIYSYDPAKVGIVKTFPSMRGAKISLTRAQAKGRYINGAASSKCAVMTEREGKVEGTEIEVRNLMSGKKVKIPANTPWCCRPDSETYWSM